MSYKFPQPVVNLYLPKAEDYFYDEAVRTLRTNIQLCGDNIRTIMITSSVPNEGKTTTGFALARSLSEIGKKVLFIDADIRKSVLITRHQIDIEIHGLSQYLSNLYELEEIIYPTNIKNFSMVLAGAAAADSTELLEEKRFSMLIEWAENEYDYIIIDTPSMMDVIDSAVIAKFCDGVALVIKSGKVSYRVAQKIKLQLEKSKCRILGVVLNKASIYRRGYYTKYYIEKK
jgi:capsular exopolysaccharide family